MTIEGSLEPTPALSYDELSYMQKQKYAYLKGMVNSKELALQLVVLIEGRGKNNFDSVIEKIDMLNNAKQSEQRYHDALYDNFKLETVYTSDEIISIVSQVRKEVGLKPYSSRWKQNCEADCFMLFIVHEVYSHCEDSSSKKQLSGYKFVFKLKIED